MRNWIVADRQPESHEVILMLNVRCDTFWTALSSCHMVETCSRHRHLSSRSFSQRLFLSTNEREESPESGSRRSSPEPVADL
jgi:hypothetical protein